MSTMQSAPTVTTRWSSAAPDDLLPVECPATGRPVALVAGAGRSEVRAAVSAAHEAFPSWSALLPRERAVHLRSIARLLQEHIDELATLESQEVGKPVGQARIDVLAAIDIFELFADFAGALAGEVRTAGHVTDLTTLVPFGVVGAVIPFNWPPIHTAGKAAPALAVGNTLVIKPAEQAPLTVMRIVELMQTVLPLDVVHVVPGGPAAGEALVADPLVRKLSFTGAPSTGARVARAAAGNLTPATMELGGKNPLLVFADADIDAALEAALVGGYLNQGEACTAASRVLVAQEVHDDFVARLAAAVQRLRVGDGADPATHVGPLVTRAQQRRVLDHIDVGREEGATLAAQAPLPTDAALADGFWVAPTLFTGVRPDMRIAREEIFGPVVVVIPFADEDEAVRIANGTDFGLVSSVFTADLTRAMRVSSRIEAGAVFINNYDRALSGSPFGGTKHSGYGREHTPATLHEYGYTRTVRLPSGLRPLPRWPVAATVLSPS